MKQPDIVERLRTLGNSLVHGRGKTVEISYADIFHASDEIKRLRGIIQRNCNPDVARVLQGQEDAQAIAAIMEEDVSTLSPANLTEDVGGRQEP